MQFSAGLLCIGISFMILPIGIHFANVQGYSSVNWVLTSYTIQSIGDLFVSPIGYALVGQLAPTKLRGMMMGTWLMFGGVTGVLADYVSKMALSGTDSLSPLITNSSYSLTFSSVGMSAIFAGIVFLISAPLLARMTKEI
jgi:POT family proton-dependent oligopeptide transporter